MGLGVSNERMTLSRGRSTQPFDERYFVDDLSQRTNNSTNPYLFAITEEIVILSCLLSLRTSFSNLFSMMEHETDPDTSYLRLLALMGQQSSHGTCHGHGVPATQSSMFGTEPQRADPSMYLQQFIMQRRIEEELRAAAMVTIARNVSPEVLALALLRKQQDQNVAARLKEQVELLEAAQVPQVNPQLPLLTFLDKPHASASLGNFAVHQETSEDSSCNVSQPTASKGKRSVRKNFGVFPCKLHQMLTDLEKSDQTHIASFVADGRAFHIHQPQAFAEKIMPKYFRMGRFSSFQRQLNLYDFQRIVDGPHKGGYFHALFHQSKPDFTFQMKRNKIKGKQQTKNQLLQIQKAVVQMQASQTTHLGDCGMEPQPVDSSQNQLDK